MLLEKKIVFKPPLDEEEPRNLIKLFDDVVEKIFSIGSGIQRITDAEKDYYETLNSDEELKTVLNSLRHHLKDGVDKTIKISEEFNRYADLWLVNIDEDLEEFTLYGPDSEEIEISDNLENMKMTDGGEIKPPTEDEFKTEISKFDQLYKIVKDFENIIKVESWLILDITLFKAKLLELIKNWQSSYKKKFVEMKHLGSLRKLEVEEEM